MSKKARSLIDDLPGECLREIFGRLSGGQARSVSACVSKRWLLLLSDMPKVEKSHPSNNGEAHDHPLTRCLEEDEATDIRLIAISVGTSHRGGLEKLEIRGSHPTRGVSDVGLKAIARASPCLKVLSLCDVPNVGNAGLLERADGCCLFKEIDLRRCPSITDEGLMAIAEKSHNLTSLTIESCQRVGNQSLQAMGRHCGQLKSVSVIACPLVGDQGVEDLVFSASSVLAELKLHGLSIGSNTMEAISRYGKALTTLVLIGLQEVGIGKVEKMESLTISSCHGTTDEVLQAIGDGCRSLKQVSLQECSLISDNGVIYFVKVCPSLEILKLEGCSNITLSGVFGVLSSCRSKFKSLALVKCRGITDLVMDTTSLCPHEYLGSLSVKNCPGFGNLSLVLVSKFFSNLHKINLSKIPEISDNGIIEFVKSCGSLKSLKLERCDRITLLGVFGVLSSCRSNLKALELVKCNGIQDLVPDTTSFSPCESLSSLTIKMCLGFGNPSLAVVSKLCPNLCKINLSGLPAITDAGLLPLVESCSKADGLVNVKLSGCAELTDNIVSYIVHRHGLSLEVLCLDGCVKVTDASLVAVVVNCTALRTLDVSRCSIADHGIAALSSGTLFFLDMVSISGCSNVTDESLPSLINLGMNLLWLNLRNCNSISCGAVEKLKEGSWGCRICA